jgi:hypothetical protein
MSIPQDPTAPSWGEPCIHDHWLLTFEDEARFLSGVEQFVRTGLQAGDGIIVIAIPAHRNALGARLALSGIDVERARREGRYLDLDAAATLRSFMREGWPDEAAFTARVQALVNGAGMANRPIRAFGEMVSLLWAQGNRAATLRLEDLWARQCQRLQISLLCAYPSGILQRSDSPLWAGICASHTRVLTA